MLQKNRLMDRMMRYLKRQKWTWEFVFIAKSPPPSNMTYEARAEEPETAFLKALVPVNEDELERITRTKGRRLSHKDRTEYMRLYMRKYRPKKPDGLGN
jgi:hypothetical protein